MSQTNVEFVNEELETQQVFIGRESLPGFPLRVLTGRLEKLT